MKKIDCITLFAVMTVMLSCYAVPSAFAHCSSFESNAVLGTELNEADVVSGETSAIVLINRGLEYTRSGSDYVVTGGTVADGLNLVVRGSGNYLPCVTVTGATGTISSVTVNLKGEASDAEDISVDLADGMSQTVSASNVYAADERIALRVSVVGPVNVASGDAADPEHLLTLGTVSFTMVKVGESTEVPESFTAVGTTYSFTNCRIATASASNDIEDDNDAKNVFDRTNGSLDVEIKDKDPNSSFVYHTEKAGSTTVNGEEFPTIVIKDRGVVSGDNIISGSGTFNLDFKIPANVKFILKFTVTSKGNEQPITVTYTEGSKTISLTLPKTTGDVFVYFDGTALKATTGTVDLSKIHAVSDDVVFNVHGTRHAASDANFPAVVKVLLEKTSLEGL